MGSREARQLKRVPTINVLSKIIENITIFPIKFSILNAEKFYVYCMPGIARARFSNGYGISDMTVMAKIKVHYRELSTENGHQQII